VENTEMSQLGTGRYGRIRGVVASATVLAMILGTLARANAADTATFAGAVMAPDGSVAQGFTVVFKDVSTGKEFRSNPTSAAGQYQVSVPTGGMYKLESAVAPDGTKLAVQNVAPIPVRVAGTNTLDVQFTRGAPAAAAAPTAAVAAGAATTAPKPAAASTTPASNNKDKKKGAVPWWKQPGPIVGMVLGGVALGALIYVAVDNNASPSHP
jgi:hypothetical protein